MSLSDAISYGEAEPGSCLPFEAETSQCPDFDSLDEGLKVRALSLAWSTIRALTGGRVGQCPIVMRPCFSTVPCGECYGPDWMSPYLDSAGDWKNARARMSGTCSCCKVCELEMPGKVAAITEVNIDGWKLDPQLFRVDNGKTLVRQDGYCWPDCQNLGAPEGAIGTITIKYLPGTLPTQAGLQAAGTLACEFSKAILGEKKCRLPSSVTSIVRQGVAMEMASSMFESGTGIREVDAYVYSVNPHGLKTPPLVWSPDLPEHRITTSQIRNTP